MLCRYHIPCLFPACAYLMFSACRVFYFYECVLAFSGERVLAFSDECVLAFSACGVFIFMRVYLRFQLVKCVVHVCVLMFSAC